MLVWGLVAAAALVVVALVVVLIRSRRPGARSVGEGRRTVADMVQERETGTAQRAAQPGSGRVAAHRRDGTDRAAAALRNGVVTEPVAPDPGSGSGAGPAGTDGTGRDGAGAAGAPEPAATGTAKADRSDTGPVRPPAESPAGSGPAESPVGSGPVGSGPVGSDLAGGDAHRAVPGEAGPEPAEADGVTDTSPSVDPGSALLAPHGDGPDTPWARGARMSVGGAGLVPLPAQPTNLAQPTNPAQPTAPAEPTNPAEPTIEVPAAAVPTGAGPASAVQRDDDTEVMLFHATAFGSAAERAEREPEEAGPRRAQDGSDTAVLAALTDSPQPATWSPPAPGGSDPTAQSRPRTLPVGPDAEPGPDPASAPRHLRDAAEALPVSGTERVGGRGRATEEERAAEQAAADDSLLRTFGFTDPALPPPAPVVALAGPASTGSAGPATTSGPGQAVRYRVVRRDGAVLSRARVRLLDDRGEPASTGVADPEGRGELRAPRPGCFVLVASADEHQPGAVALTVREDPVEVRVQVSPSAALAGTVRGGGSPLPYVRVELRQDRETLEEAVTGPDGAFAFADLAAGQYLLTVAPAGAAERTSVLRLDEGVTVHHVVEVAGEDG